MLAKWDGSQRGDQSPRSNVWTSFLGVCLESPINKTVIGRTSRMSKLGQTGAGKLGLEMDAKIGKGGQSVYDMRISPLSCIPYSVHQGMGTDLSLRPSHWIAI